ncbi:MFS transporter [Peribacillus asahii]|uniref:MFS transporter n=1 Tax=Peribacillus asahii TaxID=228899 RepID=UPI002079D8D9|nr:MFS transporter [Peribacillus asahii]USK68543.1 MFS transporter [Peribacillus asahii]
MSSTPKYSWIILMFAVFLAMINQIDKILIGLVSVPLMKELDLSASQWGLVGSSFYLFFTITSILLGGMADSKNPKKLFMWMSLIWLTVQFATPFISSFSLLLLTRIILGAGEGPASPVVTTMLGKWFPKHRHGISYAAVLFGTMMGPAIASPFLISMIDQYGWRSVFVVMGIVGLIWLVFWVFYGKASPQEIGLPSFDQVEQHSSTISKVPWRQFLPHLFSKNFILTVLAGGCAYWLVSVQSVWYPAYFSTVQQFSGQTLKLAVALPFLFAAFSQIGFAMLSDWLYRKTGDIRKARVNLASFMMVLSAICLYIGSAVNSSSISLLCFTLAPGFGIVMLSLAPAILMDLFSPLNIGKAQGAYIALSNMGSMIAPLVFGYFIQYAATEALGFHYAFQASAVGMIIIGVLFWIGVRPATRSHITIKDQEDAS